MGKSIAVDLRVHEAVRDEVYKDVVRVFWERRGGMQVNSIVKVTSNGYGPHYFAIRGLDPKDKDSIFIDWLGRQRLGNLQVGQVYKFTISTTNPWEKLKWACLASDPASRIAAWIAVWSAVLGVLGLVLGVIGVIPVVKEWIAPPEKATRPASVMPQPDLPVGGVKK